MTTLNTIPAYHRNDDGTIERISILTDGATVYDAHGFDLTDTFEDVELIGWEHDSARAYRNDGGRIIYVPIN